MNIGERIKAALKAKNMTQSKLAEITGFTDVYISNIIRGVRGKNLNIDTISAIAKALNVKIAFLLCETDSINDNNEKPYQPAVKKDIGVLLNEAMKARRISRSQLEAMNIGVKATEIGHFIRGDRTPRIKVLEDIANKLEIPMGYFFNEVSLEDALNKKSKQEDPKSAQISKLLDILNELDNSAINEIIKAAEKEKTIHDYKKVTPPTKKIS